MSVTASDIVRAAVDAAIAQLTKDGLAHEIPHLPRLFNQVLADKHGLVSVVLITPTGDAGSLKTAVADTLKKKLGHPIEIEERADPTMIGGAVLWVGDERIDMSLRGALQRMESKLLTPTSL